MTDDVEVHGVWDTNQVYEASEEQNDLSGGRAGGRGRVDVIIDSGAARSVAPLGWSDAKVEPKSPGSRDFRVADGEAIPIVVDNGFY